MKQKISKILNIVVDIIVVLILVVSVFVATLSITSKSSGVPNIFGIAPLSVQSGSMSGTFEVGDLIFCKVTNDPSIKYEKDDIVTFPIEIQGVDTLNTHRIVDVIEDDNNTYYQTKGDNKDTNPVADEQLQTSATIVAEYTGVKIGGLGTVLSFLRTQLGFFLCVLLPMIIFFLYEAVRVVLNVIAYNKEKALEEAKTAVASSELTDEQKKKAIEEYLASLNENKDESDGKS